jgi:hypothetical protein
MKALDDQPLDPTIRYDWAVRMKDNSWIAVVPAKTQAELGLYALAHWPRELGAGLIVCSALCVCRS